MKRYFHEELEAVRSHLMLMGEKAADNVNLAMRALIECDLSVAEQVIDADDMVDDIEKQIDDEVARYVSLRAPVARDLRLLFVAVQASHDLERVGDEATSVANRTKKILQVPTAPIALESFTEFDAVTQTAAQVDLHNDIVFCEHLMLLQQADRAE